MSVAAVGLKKLRLNGATGKRARTEWIGNTWLGLSDDDSQSNA